MSISKQGLQNGNSRNSKNCRETKANTERGKWDSVLIHGNFLRILKVSKEGERVYHKRGKNKARNYPGGHENIPS